MFDLVFVCLTLDSRITDFSHKHNRSATMARGDGWRYSIQTYSIEERCLSPDKSSGLLPSTPPAGSCERRGSGGWSRLDYQLNSHAALGE